MTPSEVLNAAADLIEERGWTQGVYEDASGGCCALAAIYELRPEVPTGYEARQLLRSYIGCKDITVWNDTSGRTKEEVITALREAAKR